MSCDAAPQRAGAGTRGVPGGGARGSRAAKTPAGYGAAYPRAAGAMTLSLILIRA